MITRDFNSFPDHRLNFFGFLKAVIKNAFAGFYNYYFFIYTILFLIIL